MTVACALAWQIQRSIWICLDFFAPLFLSRKKVEKTTSSYIGTPTTKWKVNMETAYDSQPFVKKLLSVLSGKAWLVRQYQNKF